MCKHLVGMTCHQAVLSFLFGREGKKKKSSSIKGQIAAFQPRGKPAIAVKQKNNISLCRLCIKKQFNFFSLQRETPLFLFTSMVAWSRLWDSRVRVIEKARTRRHPFLRARAYTSRELHLRFSENFFGDHFLEEHSSPSSKTDISLSQDILRHFPFPTWNF